MISSKVNFSEFVLKQDGKVELVECRFKILVLGKFQARINGIVPTYVLHIYL